MFDDRFVKSGRFAAGAAAVLAAVAASPALAQDEWGFGGFRVEALAGYDDEGLDLDDDVFDEATTSQSGLVFGIGAGYDFQINTMVFGIEAELTDSTAHKGRDFALLVPSNPIVGPSSATTADVDVDAGGDIYVGGRFGVAVDPQALLYAKVGYSFHKVDVDVDLFNSAGVNVYDFSDKLGLDGIRLGAGGQYNFTPNIFAKLEYRYTNYSNGDLDTGNATVDELFHDIGGDRHQGVAAVGWRF